MADVDAAIDCVLKWEDATLSGVITHTPDGLRTRFGIDEHYHPELTNSLFYGSMGAVAALVVAQRIYAEQYAAPLQIDQIADQDVANKLLSLGVNIGIAPAAKMLQNAVSVTADGCIGVHTLLALSRSDTLTVLADLRAQASRYYTQIAASNPDDEIFLKGWLNRANA